MPSRNKTGVGGMDDNVHRNLNTRVRRDNRLDPPQYVDEEVPSVSVIMGARTTRGLRNPVAGTVEASYYITGSQREFTPGTYGMRVTRLSLLAGSSAQVRPTLANTWYIRHSRDGTYDVINVGAGVRRAGVGYHEKTGEPDKPLYTFGPGTVLWAWVGTAMAGSRAMHLEGFPSVRRPDTL